MIPKELKAPIMSFIERASEIPNLKRVVLFGSILEGDMSKKSDIDLALFCHTEHNPELGEEAKVARQLANEIEDKYDLKYPFSFVLISTQNLGYTDSHFLHQLESGGLTIWSKEPLISPKDKHPDLEAHFLFAYSTKDLAQKTKLALMRKLHGFESIKKQDGKVYKTKWQGLISKYGKEIGRGAVLVKGGHYAKFIRLFEKYKVKYQRWKIWL